MEKWELAQADREQHGMKYQEIAEKYGVSVNTVKSWASRYWKKGKEAAAPVEGCNPIERLQPEKFQPAPPPPQSRGGAPPGNQNAKGNRGGKGGPTGNENAMTHGAYTRKQYAALVDEDTLDHVLGTQVDDTLELLDEKIKDLKLQEAYYLGRISAIKTKYAGGMGIYDATKTTKSKYGQRANETVTTRTIALDDLLGPLYTNLGRVQRLLLAAIQGRDAHMMNLRKLDIELIKLQILTGDNDSGGSGESNFEEAMQAAVDEAWEGYSDDSETETPV